MALNLPKSQDTLEPSSKGVWDMIQKQLEREFLVEKTYIAIAVWAQVEGLVELGKFFMYKAIEEKSHAVMHINLMIECGKTPIIPTTLDTLPDLTCVDCCLDHTYITEQEFTGYFTDIYKAAVEQGEGRVIQFALDFLKEQTEEENWALSLMKLWKICGGSLIDFDMAVSDYSEGNNKHGLGLV